MRKSFDPLERAQRTERVLSTLARYKAMTLKALLERIPDREPRAHLYDLLPLYPERGGKGLRCGLCLATCAAFGGDPSHALPAATAIEMCHNGFLIHDDIEDGSEDRRGLPTLHQEFGVPLAINAGDAMHVLALGVLNDNMPLLGSDLAWAVFQEIEHMVRESVEGQAMELGWVHDNACELEPDDYLRMILKKTCWYTCMVPVRIGALIGTGGAIDPDRFNRFAYYMGAAFQIQDDLLNLLADHAKYGKEIGGDIWEGKRTLMLIHVLASSAPDEHLALRDFLASPRPSRSPDDVAWVRGLMDVYGSIEFGRRISRILAGAALYEFERAYADAADGPDKRFIEDIVLYMIERDL